MFTLTKNTNCIIKSHCFDVEGGQDCLLVSQGWIIIRRNLGTRFVCWSLLFCVVTLAERITHISHRLTLTALRSALLRGDPWHGFCQIKTENWQQYVLHLELIFLASFEEFSTLFWCSRPRQQSPDVINFQNKHISVCTCFVESAINESVIANKESIVCL